MSEQTTIHSLEFKLYPNTTQERTLFRWLWTCRWIYNRALEHRIKAYSRRQQSVSFYDQSKLLTGWRDRMERLRLVPVGFERDAMRRVDRGMKAFFRRCKAGEKPGFPRFKSRDRYNSLEYLMTGNYLGRKTIRVPGLGWLRARGDFRDVSQQKGIRVIKRSSGWYVQVIAVVETQPLPPTGETCGIDLGLESFLTLDTGERVANPRHLRKTARRLRAAQKRLSRAKRGSHRRQHAKRCVAVIYERLANQRKGFCHRVSRDIVNRFDRIAIEDLNIKGLARSCLAKHVLDACWGTFVFQLTYKAEEAGSVLVKVDPNGTSQECPHCGHIRRKELSEREHNCESCGLRCHRDHAAALVIRDRAFRPESGGPVRLLATEAGPMKLAGCTKH